MNNIAAAVAAAQAAAAGLASGGAVPATVPTQGTAVAPAAPRRNFSAEDYMAGGMTVDEFLKVKEYALFIGDNKSILTELVVDIDMTEVQFTEVIRFGDPATYLKTYDGVTCVQGGTWEAALARAKSVDPNSYAYKSADIPAVLPEDVKNPKGELIAAKGTRVGMSLTATNKANFQSFLREAPSGQMVRVRLTPEAKSNKGGKTWGVFKFELVSVLSE